MNHVLVDYENVTAVDLRDLKRDDFRVTVFLGSSQLKLASDLVLQMQALGDRGEYVQVSGNGRNALDFHIAFTIGQKCGNGAACYFHIISNDGGFDPLISYLKSKKIPAARYKSIAEIPAVKAVQQTVKASKPTTAAARAQCFFEKISAPKSPRPRTLQTLTNAIRAAFHRQLADKDVNEVIEELCSRGLVEVKDGKVTYPASS